MKCKKCNKDVTALINSLCSECFSVQSSTPSTVTFNYECPTCSGRFNEPAYSPLPGTFRTAYCPFCGQVMMGLNK